MLRPDRREITTTTELILKKKKWTTGRERRPYNEDKGRKTCQAMRSRAIVRNDAFHYPSCAERLQSHCAGNELFSCSLSRASAGTGLGHLRLREGTEAVSGRNPGGFGGIRRKVFAPDRVFFIWGQFYRGRLAITTGSRGSEGVRTK